MPVTENSGFPLQQTSVPTRRHYMRRLPKTPDSALRSLDKMLIYLCVNSAFVSVASLDSEVFGGCHDFKPSKLGNYITINYIFS